MRGRRDAPKYWQTACSLGIDLCRMEALVVHHLRQRHRKPGQLDSARQRPCSIGWVQKEKAAKPGLMLLPHRGRAETALAPCLPFLVSWRVGNAPQRRLATAQPSSIGKLLSECSYGGRPLHGRSSLTAEGWAYHVNAENELASQTVKRGAAVAQRTRGSCITLQWCVERKGIQEEQATLKKALATNKPFPEMDDAKSRLASKRVS
jgi:hypothetical protein